MQEHTYRSGPTAHPMTHSVALQTHPNSRHHSHLARPTYMPAFAHNPVVKEQQLWHTSMAH